MLELGGSHGPVEGGKTPRAARGAFDDEVTDPQGWEKFNAHHWRRDYEDFAETMRLKLIREICERPIASAVVSPR